MEELVHEFFDAPLREVSVPLLLESELVLALCWSVDYGRGDDLPRI